MLPKALSSVLIGSLIGSCLLTGCESNYERFYKPARVSHGSVIAPPATPLVVRVLDPQSAGKQLAQKGYVLIGTTSFTGAFDLEFVQKAAAQGKRVGAAVVLLKVEVDTFRDAGYVAYLQFDPHNGNYFVGTYYATYWAKANTAGS